MSCHTHGNTVSGCRGGLGVAAATAAHPVVLLPQLLRLLLVRLLLALGQFAPHLAQFLGAVADGQPRELLLDAGAVLAAEHEERRPAGQAQGSEVRGRGSGVASAALRPDLRGSLGCVGVFPLAAPLPEALRGDVVPHLPVVADLVGFGHVLEALLVPGRQSLERQQAWASVSTAPRGTPPGSAPTGHT